MVGLLITFAIVIFCTVLGTMVAVRAWDFFPSRIFVFCVATLVLMNIITSTRIQITDPHIGYVFAGLSVIVLSLLTIALLLLFSALFVPQWWHGSRPVRWIVLPYAVVMLLLGIDIVARTGWFVDGIQLEEGVYRFELVRPNAIVILTLFTAGWMVHIALLSVIVITRPGARLTASLLGLSLLITIVANTVTSSVVLVQGFSNIMATVPIMSAMGYAVLRTQLLIPTRAGINQAVEAMDEALVIVDMSDTVVYVNPAAIRFGFARYRALPEPLNTPTHHAIASNETSSILLDNTGSLPATRTLTLTGRQLILSRTPVTDPHGDQIGTLLLGRDVTEIENRNTQLAHV